MKTNLILIWILIGVVARLLPHPPNVTPLLALSFLAGMQLSKREALIIVIATLILSDIGLAYLQNHAAFGMWTLFTYSGFILTTLIVEKIIICKKWQLFFYIVPASLGYWIWTNLGVWLTSNLYPLTLEGLKTCFIMALPFLQNSLCGDLFWLTVFLLSTKVLEIFLPHPKKAVFL